MLYEHFLIPEICISCIAYHSNVSLLGYSPGFLKDNPYMADI